MLDIGLCIAGGRSGRSFCIPHQVCLAYLLGLGGFRFFGLRIGHCPSYFFSPILMFAWWAEKWAIVCKRFFARLHAHHDTRHSLWHATYLNKFSPKVTLIGVELDTAVRGWGKNGFACSKGYHGKANRWETWTQWTRSRNASGVVTIRRQQVH